MARFRRLVSFTTLLNIQGDLGGGGGREPRSPQGYSLCGPKGNCFFNRFGHKYRVSILADFGHFGHKQGMVFVL